MRPLFARLLCIIAAITLMDGHIITLQSYAWITMLNERIPERGLSEAFATTFDARHPCEHCLTAEKLQQGSKKEKPSFPDKQLGNLKLIGIRLQRIQLPPAALVARLAHSIPHELPVLDYHASTPSPPPRAAV